MIRTALISQREVDRPDRGEVWDCVDRAWVQVMSLSGLVAVPVPNDPAVAEALAGRLDPAVIVLSGGGDPPGIGEDQQPSRNETEAVLLDCAAERRTPVLAVCRGLLHVAGRLGGVTIEVADHVAVRHRIVGPLPEAWAGPNAVASFHNYAIDESTLPVGWQVVARSHPDGLAEAVASSTSPFLGVLWHPERTPRHWDAVWSLLSDRRERGIWQWEQ